MAYSTGAVTATELARRAKDYPLLIGRNWMRDYSAAKWRNTGIWGDATDDTHTDGPVLCALDEFDHEWTYPDSSGAARYLIVDFGSEIAEIDCVGIRNCYGCAASTVSFEISDDNAYGVNLLELASWVNPANGSHLTAINLPSAGGGPARYSSVRYLRIKVAGAAAIPKFGEVLVGRSRQLSHNPPEPFDRRNLLTMTKTSESDTGVRTQYVQRRKERRINAELLIGTDTDEADYEAFWETDMDGGAGCFLWIDQPTTAPTVAWWMLFPEPEMSKPRSNWAERRVPFDAVEQGPNFVAS